MKVTFWGLYECLAGASSDSFLGFVDSDDVVCVHRSKRGLLSHG